MRKLLKKNQRLARNAVITVASFAICASASADLPEWVATEIAAAKADGLSITGLVGPAVAGLAVAWVIVKMVRKGISKIG